MHIVGEIQVRVELDDAEVGAIVAGAHQRVGDRVVAAERRQQGATPARAPRRRLDRRDRALLAGPHHRHIAKIDHPHPRQYASFSRNIPVAGRLPVGPERAAQRRFTNRAWAVARAAAQASAAIPRHAHHHHIGLDLVIRFGQRRSGEGRDSIWREEDFGRHRRTSSEIMAPTMQP